MRIRLKGIGVVIENTPDFYTSSPITLLPRVPVMLSGAMLRENFKYENLTAQGVDLEALYAGASLPSGFYQWEITAFLADQRQVSNVGMAMMTVFKNNPPQITFPQNNAVLMNTGFQSINFTWMPRHRYSTNAAAGTVYTFKIYEIPNEEGEETDPNIIANSGVLPLFSTQSFGTNYNYKPSDPLLVPGRRYVIQVQAADINGQDEFENNGLSEASTFSFGNPSEAPAMKLCKKPSNFLAEKLDEQSVQLTWQETNSEAPIDYLVSYRTENEGVWTERIVQEQSLTLIQLAPAKYQFKVSARCTYDNKSAFTTPESLELSKPEAEKETPEAEPQDTYVNTDEPVTPPTVYEPETEPEPAIDPLNTPLRIILDPSENPSLPDTLKLPKGYENLGSLPVLGDKPTAEQLKEALKTKKPDCSALLANYQCGQNDIPSVPSGDIIQPNVGDEIAINSIAFEIVDLDGSGNGRGIVKVPMFNNAKFGVKFENIKVAKGGCVVSGQAILSDVDVALLSEEQRNKLAEAYEAFNKVLDVVDKYAEEISETYNSVADFVQKTKEKISNYVGGAKDAIKMKKAFKAAETYTKELLKNPNLSDSTRTKLKAAYDEAMATKDFFCSGKDCAEVRNGEKKGGPNFELIYIEALCQENKKKLTTLGDMMFDASIEANDKGKKEKEKEKVVDNLALNICDVKVENDKIYIKTDDKCKLTAQLTTKPEIKTIDIEVDIKGSDKEKIKKKFNIKTNELQDLPLESMSEGKYTISYKQEGKTLTKSFYFRHKKYDFACTVCGRDLNVNQERLKLLYNEDVTNEDATTVNDALQKAGFNTCKKHIHFFSQTHVETLGFTKFVESPEYSLPRFLVVFPKNCNLKQIFNQDFWNNKTYKEYFSLKIFEYTPNVTTAKYVGKSVTKFSWNPVGKVDGDYCKDIQKEKSDTIRIPTDFKKAIAKKEVADFTKISFTNAEKNIIQDKLMSLTYANRIGNGPPSSHDGYNFRGRGAVHLTFRETYKDVSKIANTLYGTTYDWEKNFSQVTTDKKSIIYSATAFFHYKLGKNSVDKLGDNLKFLQDNGCTSVSRKVNGGDNGLLERIKRMNELIDLGLFECTIPKQ